MQELIFWAVDGQEARKISRDYLMHTGFLYRLVLYDDELSYDNFKEGFDIGIFSSYSKAEETKKYYLEHKSLIPLTPIDLVLGKRPLCSIILLLHNLHFLFCHGQNVGESRKVSG